jgi:hypothetical protein
VGGGDEEKGEKKERIIKAKERGHASEGKEGPRGEDEAVDRTLEKDFDEPHLGRPSKSQATKHFAALLPNLFPAGFHASGTTPPTGVTVY